eukprot:3155987-Amphidinium_carterae.1
MHSLSRMGTVAWRRDTPSAVDFQGQSYSVEANSNCALAFASRHWQRTHHDARAKQKDLPESWMLPRCYEMP